MQTNIKTKKCFYVLKWVVNRHINHRWNVWHVSISHMLYTRNTTRYIRYATSFTRWAWYARSIFAFSHLCTYTHTLYMGIYTHTQESYLLKCKIWWFYLIYFVTMCTNSISYTRYTTLNAYTRYPRYTSLNSLARYNLDLLGAY